jgi:hypothetical protein
MAMIAETSISAVNFSNAGGSGMAGTLHPRLTRIAKLQPSASPLAAKITRGVLEIGVNNDTGARHAATVY